MNKRGVSALAGKMVFSSVIGMCLLAILLVSRATGAPITPYTPNFDWKTAWNGLEITFQTNDPDGTKVWEYIHGDQGEWRLTPLGNAASQEMTLVFDGKTRYHYDPRADLLSEMPVPSDISYQIGASYLLRPYFALAVGDPGRWDVVGRSKMKGFPVVEVAKKDGSERLWINPDHGLPIKWVSNEHSWELLTVKFDQKHGAERFAPPQAKNMKQLHMAPKN